MFSTKILKEQIQDIFFNLPKLDQSLKYYQEILSGAKESFQKRVSEIESPLMRQQISEGHIIDYDFINKKLKEVPQEFHNQLSICFLHAQSKRESNLMLAILSTYGHLKDFSALDKYFITLYSYAYIHYTEYLEIDPPEERCQPTSAFYVSQQKFIKYFLKTDLEALPAIDAFRLMTAAGKIITRNGGMIELKHHDEAQIIFLKFLLRNRKGLMSKLHISDNPEMKMTFQVSFNLLKSQLKRFLG
jgi:hypothetical protein